LRSRQSGLHDLQNELPAPGLVLAVARVGAESVAADLVGAIFVLALFLREIVEQLASTGVGGARGGALVESTRLELHAGGLLAHSLDRQRPYEPHRLTRDEAFHVVSPDMRDVIAESRLVQLDQAAAMPGLLLTHGFEHVRGCGVLRAQTVSEVAVDALVLLFQCDRERQDFALVEAVEIAHASIFACYDHTRWHSPISPSNSRSRRSSPRRRRRRRSPRRRRTLWARLCWGRFMRCRRR